LRLGKNYTNRENYLQQKEAVFSGSLCRFALC
jgi:hypothetical protein